MNRLLELDAGQRWARVEPGLVRDELNARLAEHGLCFAPDPATSSRANVGGMIGNNSSGTKSILYGKTIDPFRRLVPGAGAAHRLPHRDDGGFAAASTRRPTAPPWRPSTAAPWRCCGLDVDYPLRQRDLAAAIAERGALVSEFPFGAEPRPWHFPIRNRVIAALPWATLVVQATPRSGSLITAHHAMELGRDVYAVPGRIFDERSLGTNHLLADGALVARCPEDLIEGAARHGLAMPGQRPLFAPPDAETPPAPVPPPRRHRRQGAGGPAAGQGPDGRGRRRASRGAGRPGAGRPARSRRLDSARAGAGVRAVRCGDLEMPIWYLK
jgi:hypothetical protein